MKSRKKVLLVLLIMMLALVACAENDDETPLPPTVEPAATVAQEAAPTAAPAETPTAEAEAQLPPAPTTAAADSEGAEAAENTEANAGAERLGLLRFRDSQVEGEPVLVRSGAYQLLLQGVSPPPAGSHYELWLVDGSFNTLNLGPFPAESNVDYSGSAAEDLLASYDGALISIEPDGEDDGKIGPLAFNGLIPAESLLHIRHVVTAFQGNPEGKAFLTGAEEQLLLAAEHTGFMLEELAADNIREAQRHAEHVVNILDGESGANFGDLDGDTIAQNPGDGFGVRAYVEGAKQHAQLASDAEGATAEVQLHAEHVQISGDNMLLWIDESISEALRVIASDSSGEAQGAAEALAQQLDLAYVGQDVDGDGAIAPIAGEGGWQTAYEHALNMGSFEFFAAGPENAPQQEAAPAESAAPAEATTQPTVEPTATPAAVSIEMANFAFQPGDITVAAGTSVTWVNSDSGARHSATASDGSFDTGLLDAGQEATIVLDTPGTYIYYCTLHGSPDGSGMAATITVTE